MSPGAIIELFRSLPLLAQIAFFMSWAAMFNFTIIPTDTALTKAGSLHWSPPTYGTPVEHYIVYLHYGGQTNVVEMPTDTTIALQPITFTVTGVDSLDREGPPSNHSIPIAYIGLPYEDGD